MSITVTTEWYYSADTKKSEEDTYLLPFNHGSKGAGSE